MNESIKIHLSLHYNLSFFSVFENEYGTISTYLPSTHAMEVVKRNE